MRPNSNSLISALSGETRWAEDTIGLVTRGAEGADKLREFLRGMDSITLKKMGKSMSDIDNLPTIC
jgi:hypothetical protein